ncbi:hypothetical protein M5689_025165 [Euphorbia peplus]|nr:hypothetical protein M5689_025165 [Euphorbia peplus]
MEISVGTRISTGFRIRHGDGSGLNFIPAWFAGRGRGFPDWSWGGDGYCDRRRVDTPTCSPISLLSNCHA